MVLVLLPLHCSALTAATQPQTQHGPSPCANTRNTTQTFHRFMGEVIQSILRRISIFHIDPVVSLYILGHILVLSFHTIFCLSRQADAQIAATQRQTQHFVMELPEAFCMTFTHIQGQGKPHKTNVIFVLASHPSLLMCCHICCYAPVMRVYN